MSDKFLTNSKSSITMGSFDLECCTIEMLACPIGLVFKDVKANFKGIVTQLRARFGKLLGILQTALG